MCFTFNLIIIFKFTFFTEQWQLHINILDEPSKHFSRIINVFKANVLVNFLIIWHS